MAVCRSRCQRVSPPRQKRRDHLLQPLRTCRFITLWKLRPAATKHSVDVAHEIPFVLRQRRRISQYHQQTAVQRDLCAIQRAQQQIDNLHGRGFIPVNAGRKQQRQVILPRRRQFKHARPQPSPVERRAFPSCRSGVSSASVSARKFSISSP